MTIPKHTDVVVIGGGPAGSMAATYLRQRGYEVVLFDKKRHPRYNVGESLIPHIWKYLNLAGATDAIRGEGFVKKMGGTVVWDGVIRQLAFKNFGYQDPALHVERDRFDYLLLERARALGTQVFEEVTVLGARLGDEPAVSYRIGNERTAQEVACRFVIDASGQAAVIARQLGVRVIDEAFRFMSVWGYYKDSRYIAIDGRAHPFEELAATPPTTFVTSITLDNQPRGGWAWHIPLRESTSVGLVLPIEQMKAVPSGEASLERYFRAKCAELPYFRELLAGATYCEGEFHAMRDYSYKPTQLAGPGFFLTGDAAAFIDPIFSVGAVLAMYCAYIAAWAIDQSFRTPARTAQYRDIYAGQVQGRVELSRSLALPPYGLSGDASQHARSSIQFENGLEQELMYVVSTLTSRSDNFTDMAHGRNGDRITSERFRVLERIEL